MRHLGSPCACSVLFGTPIPKLALNARLVQILFDADLQGRYSIGSRTAQLCICILIGIHTVMQKPLLAIESIEMEEYLEFVQIIFDF